MFFLAVLIVVFVPLIIAQAIKYFLPQLQQRLIPYKFLSFYLFNLNVFLAISKARDFLSNESDKPISFILLIALIILIICACNFAIGWLIGGKNYRAEFETHLRL